eukprot:Gb_24855 [translate_table: standard]
MPDKAESINLQTKRNFQFQQLRRSNFRKPHN